MVNKKGTERWSAGAKASKNLAALLMIPGFMYSGEKSGLPACVELCRNWYSLINFFQLLSHLNTALIHDYIHIHEGD